TAAITNLFLLSNEVSEDAGYEITKALFESLEQIQVSHNAAKDITLETVDVCMPIPFHPGADRYFKEVGALD
uniref:TAXI family TRAP transporter solute-binding subunit n=1 Tax=Halalkalibacter lacteus TaxID=3090663 RepID=UPI002FCC862C